jgi:4-hydroxybenzoate polyprenyltransferase
VLIVSITGLALSGILLLSFHWLSFLGSLAAVFGLATYSFVKKQYWFGGPFYNGWIVALLP